MPKLNAPPEPAAAAAEGEEDSPEEASVGTSAYGGKSANNFMGGGGGAYSNPFLRGPAPIYAGAGGPASAPEAPAASGKDRVRVQDEGDLDHWRSTLDSAAAGGEEELGGDLPLPPSGVGGGSHSGGSRSGGGGGGFGGQVERGPAMCLSMHQPWASLLIAGIKTVEGRSWPTAHRGRLWIASTAQACDPSEAEAMRQEHEEQLGDGPVRTFPAHFPSSVLLGCVEVADCIDQDEYRSRVALGQLAAEDNRCAAEPPLGALSVFRTLLVSCVFSMPRLSAERALPNAARSISSWCGSPWRCSCRCASPASTRSGSSTPRPLPWRGRASAHSNRCASPRLRAQGAPSPPASRRLCGGGTWAWWRTCGVWSCCRGGRRLVPRRRCRTAATAPTSRSPASRCCMMAWRWFVL